MQKSMALMFQKFWGLDRGICQKISKLISAHIDRENGCKFGWFRPRQGENSELLKSPSFGASTSRVVGMHQWQSSTTNTKQGHLGPRAWVTTQSKTTCDVGLSLPSVQPPPLMHHNAHQTKLPPSASQEQNFWQHHTYCFSRFHPRSPSKPQRGLQPPRQLQWGRAGALGAVPPGAGRRLAEPPDGCEPPDQPLDQG